jgi:hypothetical protein
MDHHRTFEHFWSLPAISAHHQVRATGSRYFFINYISLYLVFEGPVHATGKKPEPSRTESEKTGTAICGCVRFPTGCDYGFPIFQLIKNRMQLTMV